MPTTTDRAAVELDRLLRKAPARVANASRNAGADRDRHRRWAPVRDALWDFVAPVLEEGARVAIVGAGNGDDLPLGRIAARAGAVVLIDIDPRAAARARRRSGRAERRKVEVIGHDVTVGAADAIALAKAESGTRPADAVDLKPGTRTSGRPPGAPRDVVDLRTGTRTSGRPPGAPRGVVDLRAGTRTSGRPRSAASPGPLPGAPYDLVIGDLFYSQLLYPALLDLGIAEERIDDAVAAHAPSLIGAVVARLHASAPLVIHVHDPLAWWEGHEQPVSLGEILDLAERDGPEAALELAARGSGPHETDPRAALAALGPTATALWRWPFSEGVDYLACATRAGEAPQS